MITLYKDDLLIAGSTDIIVQIKTVFYARFKVEDCEEAKDCLGCGIQRDRSRKILKSVKHSLPKSWSDLTCLTQNLAQLPLTPKLRKTLLLKRYFQVHSTGKLLDVNVSDDLYKARHWICSWKAVPVYGMAYKCPLSNVKMSVVLYQWDKNPWDNV